MLWLKSCFSKCSVSCGTGIQVRKVDCILPVNANDSTADKAYSQNAGVRSDYNAHGHITSLSDASNNESIDSAMVLGPNERFSMGCNAKWKPITIQPCTTGIECTTTIANRNDESVDNAGTNNDHTTNVDRTTTIPSDDETVAIDRMPVNGNQDSSVERIDESIDANVEQSAFEASVESDNGNVNEDNTPIATNNNQKPNSDNNEDEDDDDDDENDNNSGNGDGGEDIEKVNEYEV